MTESIEVRGLRKYFGRVHALDGLDLIVGEGEIHGFLGPNGAGKSTTLRVLSGMYRRDAGLVRVLGLDPGVDPAAVTRRISYVPGDVALWPGLTGREVLDALAGLRGGVDRALEHRLVDRFALDVAKPMRSYSKGNRQKVMLVAAFAARTRLLVLDEPTSGLDPLMDNVFRQCVREAVAQGRTVLLSSHDLTDVERLCERVTIIKDGRTVENGPLSQLRHLSASHITAVLAESVAGFETDAAGRLDMHVPAAEVNAVLRRLAEADASEIMCAPATLDEVFLRHYETATR
jgi:ABC-2 type transport system ATP-binding protein